MYLSAEALLGPSQVTKVKLFARKVNVFKLTLLTIFAKSNIINVWRALIATLIYSNVGN